MIELHEYEANGTRVIAISGTLDAPNTMNIEGEFQSLFEHEHNPVILDLSEVDYISSYGLRMLLTTAQSLHEGGGLHLAAANEHVMRIINVAGYDSMFPVYESVDDAAAALAG